MQIRGQVALVTGGAIGTGRVIALALAAAGAVVTVADVDEDGGRETVRRAPAGRCRFRRADVTSAPELAHLVGSVRPRILVNNAGGGGHLPSHFPRPRPSAGSGSSR